MGCIAGLMLTSLGGGRVAASETRPYRPAVLRLSFSNIEGDQNSFIDHTLIPPDGEPIGKRTGVNRTDFRNILRAFYKQISSMAPISVADATEPARKMYNLLIGPLQEDLKRLGITTLLLSMDIELQSVPLAALHDGERWFGSSFAYSVTPSISLMPRVDSQPGNQTSKKLLVGTSKFENLSPLPLVKQELKKISTISESTVAIDEEFDHETLFSQANSEDTNIIHLATHAEFIPGNPDKSRIFMRKGSFTMDELRQLRLSRQRYPLDLFTLSACRTAVGDSDSELGLAGLALLAGAQSAIGTLWYVDDVATSLFFVRFYTWLHQGVSKSEAMRHVRDEFINQELTVQSGKVFDQKGETILTGLTRRQEIKLQKGMNHPYFWAAPLLMGKPW